MSLPLVKATYLAHAASCFFGRASTDTIQIGAHMTIDDGEFAGGGIAWIGFFTDATSDRTIESLRHMGWVGDDLSELDNLDADGCSRLLPKQVELVCEPELYDGTTRLKVRWVNAASAGRLTFKSQLSAGDLKAFAAQMRGQIRNGARVKSPAQPAAQRQTHSASKHGDDDLPY